MPYMTPAQHQQHAATARTWFTKAHEQFPGHPWFLRNWAQHEMEQGNRDGAIAKLTEMERLDPLNLTAYQEWSKFAYVDPVMRASALAAMRRGLAAFPPGSDAAAALYQARVEIPRNAGEYGPALSAALEFTSQQPERLRAWRELCELYERGGRRDLAISNAQLILAKVADRKLGPAEEADRAALAALTQRLSQLPAQPPMTAAGR